MSETHTPAVASADAPITGHVDRAVAEGGAYEVLRRRLQAQGARLRTLTQALNDGRVAAFGSSRMEAIGRIRVRTEHNCVARDIVQVGDVLLFGYNVFIGLKKETRVEDVFSLYRLVEGAEGYDVTPVEIAGSFLADPVFAKDFAEVFAYYKHARLLQLVRREGLLLAAFQIGERIEDTRVFRWRVDAAGAHYVDNRGERDIALPAAHDFEWVRATREQAVQGRHPHLNILDTVFVECIDGDLTVKIENNTATGLGIYSEPVEDRTQSLDDAQIDYARIGGKDAAMVLLRVLPYRETKPRYLVYNTVSRRVHRIDAIGQACVQLPEDHGIVFPGGYLLQNGELRTFDADVAGMRYKRTLRAPNGEDVLYLFYEPEDGRIALCVYNTIERELRPPVIGHGYARFDDGRMVVFSAQTNEPTRIHPMQIWRTPFASDEHAAQAPAGSGFFARVGNPELVRGVSELLVLAREIDSQEVSAQRYQLLAAGTRRLFDRYHWLEDAQCEGLAPLLREVVATSESVLDEFEKVEDIRRRSGEALAEATQRQKTLLGALDPDRWEQVQDCVDALNALSAQRGRLLTIRELRYIDTDAVDALQAALAEAQARGNAAAATFLAGERALAPFAARVQALDSEAQAAAGAAALRAPLEAMAALAADLDMLSTLMAGIEIDDAAQRTRIVEAISEVYARLNQTRARADQRRRALGADEAVAQFGAQFALLGQSVAGALAAARDPESCDRELSRLLVQLEELESRFGEHERFLGDIVAKREEILESFERHKQALTDERQRKAQAMADAAARILEGLSRRTARLEDIDALNAFFSGDALILKLRDLAGKLRALGDSVRADDIEAKLKGARDQSVRALRDKTDLYEDGGNVVRLGPRHRFSVNTQELDLTLLPRGDALALHLTGTDYYAPVDDAEFDALRAYWQSGLASESEALYRGEYLLGELLDAAEGGRDGLSLDLLRLQLPQPETLARTVRDFAAPRYRDGYEKGIHDHDAALLLAAWLPLRDAAGLLAHPPAARGWATVFRAHGADADTFARWQARAIDAHALARAFARDGQPRAEAQGRAREALCADIAAAMASVAEAQALPVDSGLHRQAAACLVDLLADARAVPVFSRHARALVEGLRARLVEQRLWDGLQSTLHALGDDLAARWRLLAHWLDALCAQPEHAADADYAPEALAVLLGGDAQPHWSEVALRTTVAGLLGEHARIVDGRTTLAVDDLAERLHRHRSDYLPGYRRYQALRHDMLVRERASLRLSEFKPRPLSAFVRNRLIDQVYLPIVGDNLAKQMGTVGEGKRSDLMGLLMLISPPGYGKTTLMEYVAHRLGLIFMKINGPALGHEVRSLDPAQAPDATSRQELEKLNLALEMGNNVMLYVDDIQHTHPEFLQKFISLCDGTRRIEGVWRGRTRTYDLRGKKFCVVMAGNPYTESGEVFKIPDMLANRADIYNLGDTLGGMEDAFKLSYIENCLTSNAVLAPLATRDLADLYRFVDKLEGRAFSANDLSHDYGAAEIGEIVTTLEKLAAIREVVYRVNKQYIASAAQADRYRTEPPFKLQGSYRNMNKMAEKISAAMNDAELQQLVADHYLGEAQLLTTGAEENLLKLAELRGTLGETDGARWAQIKRDFLRHKAMGGEDADTGQRVVAQLADLVEGVRALEATATQTAAPTAGGEPWPQLLDAAERHVERLASALQAGQGARIQPVATDAAQPAAADMASAAVEAVETASSMQAALPAWFERHSEQQQRLHEALLLLIARLDSPADGARARPPAGRRRGATATAELPPDERELQLQKALEEFSDRLLGRTPR